MATDTLSASNPSVQEFDTGLVEDVAADLQVAEAFADVSESLLSGIRVLFEGLGHDPKNFRDFLNLDIIQFELLDKIRTSRQRLNEAVEKHFEACRAAKDA